MAALWCGEEGAPGGPFYRARARPELRRAQEGLCGTVEQFRGFAARERKVRVVSEAEGIKEFNAHTKHGDAAGFELVWKVFEMRQWRSRREEGKQRGGRKERKETTGWVGPTCRRQKKKERCGRAAVV